MHVDLTLDIRPLCQEEWGTFDGLPIQCNRCAFIWFRKYPPGIKNEECPRCSAYGPNGRFSHVLHCQEVAWELIEKFGMKPVFLVSKTSANTQAVSADFRYESKP